MPIFLLRPTATSGPPGCRVPPLGKQFGTMAVQQEASTTLAEFMADWMELVRPSLRERTWESYAQVLRSHLVPGLGGLDLSEITPRMHLLPREAWLPFRRGYRQPIAYWTREGGRAAR